MLYQDNSGVCKVQAGASEERKEEGVWKFGGLKHLTYEEVEYFSSGSKQWMMQEVRSSPCLKGSKLKPQNYLNYKETEKT